MENNITKEPEHAFSAISSASARFVPFERDRHAISPVASYITPAMKSHSPDVAERFQELAAAMSHTDLDTQGPSCLLPSPPSFRSVSRDPLLDPYIGQFVLFPIKQPLVRLHSVRVV